MGVGLKIEVNLVSGERGDGNGRKAWAVHFNGTLYGLVARIRDKYSVLYINGEGEYVTFPFHFDGSTGLANAVGAVAACVRDQIGKVD